MDAGKPKLMPVQPEKIPPELKTGRQFCGWKWEREKKTGKWTKVPYRPNGYKAKPNDPSTWATFEEVLTAHQGGKFDGVGRFFTKEDPFTAFDLDDCRNGDGKPALWAAAIMTRLDTYTEITPSGTGFRPWVIAKKPGPRSGRKNPDVEIYDCTSKRYLCLTGNTLNGQRIDSRQAETNEIYKELFEEPESVPAVVNRVKPPQKINGFFVWDGNVNHLPIKPETKNAILNGFPEGSRSEPMMGVLNALVWSNLTDTQIIEVFEQYPIGAKYREKGNIGEQWLRPQIDKARARVTERAEAAKRPQEQCTREPGDESGSDLEPECFLESLTDADEDSSDCYEWLIEKLVPKGEPMIIGGKGSTGKSTQALEFSARIMEADPEAAVIYICAEGTYKDTKIKARQMGLTRFGRFFFLKRRGGGTSFKLSEKTELKIVAATLRQAKKQGVKIAFVVIDSIRGMQKGSLSDDLVGKVMQAINSEVCQILGATVCYIHHSKKNIDDITAMDALLGSVTIVNSVRYALFIRKQSSRVRDVEVCKSNLGYEDHYFKSQINDFNRVEMQYMGLRGDEDELDQGQLDRAEEIILSMLGKGEAVPAFQIYKLGEGEGISVETMKRVKKLHKIEVKKRGKAWFWQLKGTFAAPPDTLDLLDTLQRNSPNIIEKEEGQEGGQR